MIRGTTPTIYLTFDDADLTGASSVAVTFADAHGKKLLEKVDEGMNVSAGSIEIFLSQEETLRFPVGIVQIQVNVLFPGGIRAATQIMSIEWTQNFKNEVME